MVRQPHELCLCCGKEEFFESSKYAYTFISGKCVGLILRLLLKLVGALFKVRMTYWWNGRVDWLGWFECFFCGYTMCTQHNTWGQGCGNSRLAVVVWSELLTSKHRARRQNSPYWATVVVRSADTQVKSVVFLRLAECCFVFDLSIVKRRRLSHQIKTPLCGWTSGYEWMRHHLVCLLTCLFFACMTWSTCVCERFSINVFIYSINVHLLKFCEHGVLMKSGLVIFMLACRSHFCSSQTYWTMLFLYTHWLTASPGII